MILFVSLLAWYSWLKQSKIGGQKPKTCKISPVTAFPVNFWVLLAAFHSFTTHSMVLRSKTSFFSNKIWVSTGLIGSLFWDPNFGISRVRGNLAKNSIVFILSCKLHFLFWRLSAAYKTVAALCRFASKFCRSTTFPPPLLLYSNFSPSIS